MPVRLSLYQAYVESVVVTSTVSIPQAMQDQIMRMVEDVGQHPSLPWLFSETYTLNRHRHSVRASLDKQADDGGLSISVNFAVDVKWSEPDEPSVSRLFDVLNSGGIEAMLHGDISFEYPEGSGQSFVPIPSTPARHGPRVELRGLRLTQLDENDRIVSSIIIDRPLLSTFYHTVTVHTRGSFEKATFTSLIGRAKRLSQVYYRPALRNATRPPK